MVWMLVPSTKPDGGFGCRTAQLATTSATPSSVATRRSISAARLLPQERDVVFAPLVGGLTDHRRIRGLDHRDQQFGVDLPGAEFSVPVAARACRILGVVAVHQVNATGDALDPVDGVDQRLPRRPGMAGGGRIVSKWRAIACSPPAVSSRCTGTFFSNRSSAFP